VLKLENLELLDLSNTALSQLPAEMTKLTRLHTLLLGACRFTRVPEVVNHLAALQNLDVSRNPGLDPGSLEEPQLMPITTCGKDLNMTSYRLKECLH
jgi:Leucine-rich repeat (LRR) protein